MLYGRSTTWNRRTTQYRLQKTGPISKASLKQRTRIAVVKSPGDNRYPAQQMKKKALVVLSDRGTSRVVDGHKSMTGPTERLRHPQAVRPRGVGTKRKQVVDHLRIRTFGSGSGVTDFAAWLSSSTTTSGSIQCPTTPLIIRRTGIASSSHCSLQPPLRTVPTVRWFSWGCERDFSHQGRSALPPSVSSRLHLPPGQFTNSLPVPTDVSSESSEVHNHQRSSLAQPRHEAWRRWSLPKAQRSDYYQRPKDGGWNLTLLSASSREVSVRSHCAGRRSIWNIIPEVVSRVVVCLGHRCPRRHLQAAAASERSSDPHYRAVLRSGAEPLESFDSAVGPPPHFDDQRYGFPPDSPSQ
jgi:hypothetical protein